MFSKETYVTRREELKRKVGSGIILLMGNQEYGYNYPHNTFNFRQDSSFLYYYGLPHPFLGAIIDIDNNQEILFGDDVTIDDIVWTGPLPSLKEQADRIGVAETRPYAEMVKYVAEQARKGREIHYLPPFRPEHQIMLQEMIVTKPGQEKPSLKLIQAIVNMRNYKTAEEIVEIEKACDVTADMHIAAIKAVRPGLREYQVAAVLEEVARANGCALSFPTIATVRGQILHSGVSDRMIKPGDMLLVDAGAETAMGYAGDMSSTVCADDKFTSRQKSIYDIQVASHLAAVDALKPGIPFVDVYELSAQVICQGLKDLGIMKGDPVEAVKAGAHAMFFPCGLGHMMGLDVHDMENLGEEWVGYDGQPKSTQFGRKSLRLGRKLEPGFVLTIEPGVYFIPELIDRWGAENKFKEFINYDELNKWRDFTGIRNEEDYLITETGARRLGKKIPLTTEEVEAMRQ